MKKIFFVALLVLLAPAAFSQQTMTINNHLGSCSISVQMFATPPNGTLGSATSIPDIVPALGSSYYWCPLAVSSTCNTGPGWNPIPYGTCIPVMSTWDQVVVDAGGGAITFTGTNIVGTTDCNGNLAKIAVVKDPFTQNWTVDVY